LCNSHQIFGGQSLRVDFGPNFLTVQQLTKNFKKLEKTLITLGHWPRGRIMELFRLPNRKIICRIAKFHSLSFEVFVRKRLYSCCGRLAGFSHDFFQAVDLLCRDISARHLNPGKHQPSGMKRILSNVLSICSCFRHLEPLPRSRSLLQIFCYST
jgi:hypothetical protein